MADPNSPEAMAAALRGQQDPYGSMFGTAPQGNVAGSTLDTAKSWWQGGQSWSDRMGQAQQSGDQDAMLSLLQGIAGPASIKNVPGAVANPSYYHIIDGHTGEVVGKAQTLNRALRSVDQRDNAYGGYRFRHQPIYEDENK